MFHKKLLSMPSLQHALVAAGIALSLAVCATAAAAETKTVVYATRGDRELTLTVHYPDQWQAADTRPAIVFFFGGGWKAGSTEQFLPQAEYFASRGLVTARADYRVKSRDGVTPDACVRDARSAVRWMRENAHTLGVDPAKIISAGGSAGGHLAACMLIEDSVDAEDDDLTTSTVPAAMLLFNPVLTFAPEELRQRLGDHQDMATKISPIDHLSPATPPSLILFGTDDRLLKLAEPYCDKAEALGVRADLYLAQGQGHGFFNRSPWRERTLIAADEFLVSLGFLQGPATIEVPKAGTRRR